MSDDLPPSSEVSVPSITHKVAPNKQVCAMLMEKADRQRLLLFQAVSNKSRRRSRQAATTPGAHIGFQMAQRTTQHVYCCGACGVSLALSEPHLFPLWYAEDSVNLDTSNAPCARTRCTGKWLVRPQDILNDTQHAAAVSLDDSAHTICTESADVIEAESHAFETIDGWHYGFTGIRCRQCTVFLGVKLKTVRHKHIVHAHSIPPDFRGVRVSNPAEVWLSSALAARLLEAEEDGIEDDDSDEEAEVRVEQIFLGVRYLRVLDAQRNQPADERIALLCRECSREISHTDQLLCANRRWGFGNSLPEAACFMNSVVGTSVQVRGQYEEHLAQGRMDMADVFCKCGAQVGYKFCADRTPTKRNLNQVGRFGLVCSTFRAASLSESH
eukprot:CAMPEP_0174733160 /NCGR_PEP_ID=MMETSP1094-20130205/60780_1 /TAXON_ID=156173 /ORGANISM="Chrysochromulina brevifilum, Strain UTEX LB 985" /LENGTH=383 /DNA_ID=CAMNT_0015935783 /DNA_START=121 /DNA_END=1272 /DNA_ORIENTATION=+